MPEFSVRADSVNVEEIMRQIRARVKEKRGADYTEEEIKELAAVKLERFGPFPGQLEQAAVGAGVRSADGARGQQIARPHVAAA